MKSDQTSDATAGLSKEQGRILSVDFFRGLVMFILVSGIATLFHQMTEQGHGGAFIAWLDKHSNHGKWFDIYFWDLIQPFFMFIVGVAMPFSLSKRLARGDSWKQSFIHALKRSFWLLLLGFMLGAKDDAYYLTNILPQLGLVYVFAFLLLQKNIKWQLAVSFGLILASDLLYQFWPVEGYNMPYTPDHNFGAWLDSVTTGHLHPDHWVTFNAVPTCAHILWGVCTGKLLMTDLSPMKKLTIMLSTGIAGIMGGYLLGLYIPMIERIGTGSFVVFSGGWCLLAMGFSYLFVDILRFRKVATFFAIVGMNPIFIYIFSSLGGKSLLTRMARPFTHRIFGWGGDMLINMVTIAVVAFMIWGICYYMYKRKIFIKL
ncbi:acyltransferase family protein [Proteiniphilum sp. X52]|uniref:acyltransferase family protein n=1 Tax=Proteiniphilum sp. X52 TaxID=2382159 RepID=UPI0011CE327F|nr:DUF5009 domain-containing protein [Proteiniphilum sp. X52]